MATDAKTPPNRKRLTDAILERITRPTTGTKFIWDAVQPGFGVAISEGGSRTFVVRGRVLKDGRFVSAKARLGQVGVLGLAEARERARAWLKAADAGEDPREAKRAQVAAQVEASKLTVAALVEDFLAKRGSKLRPGTVEEYRRTLHRARDGWPGLDVAGWGPRPIGTITKHDVRRLVEAIEVEHLTAAFHGRAVLSAFFAWCRDKRDAITTNPCDGVEVEPIASRERVLAPDELADLLACVDAAGPIFGDFVRVLLLTAQRRGEVAGMRWSELDNVHAPTTWTLPPERTKNGREHVVPLSTAAARIIARQPRIAGSDFVFTSFKRNATSKTPTALNGFNKRKASIAAAIDKRRAERGAAPMQQWQLHDIRRSFATLAGELEEIRPHVRTQRAERILAGLVRAGVEITPAIRQTVTLQAGDGTIAPHVLDAVLNHVEGVAAARGGTSGVYNRSKYLEDARVVLEAWGRWLDAIASNTGSTSLPANVVRLR
jgi:integrase